LAPYVLPDVVIAGLYCCGFISPRIWGENWIAQAPETKVEDALSNRFLDGEVLSQFRRVCQEIFWLHCSPPA